MPEPVIEREKEASVPGNTTDPGDVDKLLDGFGDPLRADGAKNQAGSNGERAAKYAAVATPPKAHTDPSHLAPVILAMTAEEPLGRRLQDASRAASEVTVPPMRARAQAEARAAGRDGRDDGRDETTTPGLPRRKAVPAWLVIGLVVAAGAVGALLYVTRGPASAPALDTASPVNTGASPVTPPASATGLVVAPVPSTLPPPPVSAATPAPLPVTPMTTPPSIPTRSTSTAPSQASARPGHVVRHPEGAPAASVVAPTSAAPPRGDMKQVFE